MAGKSGAYNLAYKIGDVLARGGMAEKWLVSDKNIFKR